MSTSENQKFTLRIDAWKPDVKVIGVKPEKVTFLKPIDVNKRARVGYGHIELEPGDEFTINSTDEFVIGRNRQCDLYIEDQSQTVSNYHANIRHDRFERYFIKSDGINGTRLNGQKLSRDSEEVRLQGEGVIIFAELVYITYIDPTITFRVDEHPELTCLKLALNLETHCVQEYMSNKKPIHLAKLEFRLLKVLMESYLAWEQERSSKPSKPAPISRAALIQNVYEIPEVDQTKADDHRLSLLKEALTHKLNNVNSDYDFIEAIDRRVGGGYRLCREMR